MSDRMGPVKYIESHDGAMGHEDVVTVSATTRRELDEEVRRTLRTLAAMLEPALILFFGAIVGFVALAMLQAIYAVNAGM